MDIVNRFLSFDSLMGKALVKIVYYLGVLGIVLVVLAQMFGSFAMMGVNLGLGMGMLVGAPIFGLVAICFWRFACELYIVLFRLGEDVAALRAQGGIQASPTGAPPQA